MPPILALRDAAVTFGGPPLFADIAFALARGDRVCLIGRNGCGKSTLMKALAEIVPFDRGDYYLEPGARVVYLRQEPQFVPGETVRDHVAGGLAKDAEAADHLVDAILDRMAIGPDAPLATLSGGEARRADLARALVSDPDILLLDEPTNHLDLPAIEWLENYLSTYRGAVVMVSHDRAFLRRVGTRLFWLERGRLRQSDRGFADFERWQEEVYDREEREAQRMDKKLAGELHWLHRGVTARRRRNEGRLRRLQELRAKRAARTDPRRAAKLALTTLDQGGTMVIETDRLRFAYPATGARCARRLVDGFSTRILKGDRVGIIGPNGAGKTALLRLLIGRLAPQSGGVRLGTNLQIAYFDQTRASLDPQSTPWRVVCEDGDTVFAGGRGRHVAAYLRDFLFDERQIKSPVGSLSGGERNRLLLARILARPSNLLVLDEPTNDLDMDTLDLLQELLDDYPGTLLVVSHDRDFLDRLVTSVIAVEGEGRVRETVGGFADYVREGRTEAASKPAAKPAAKAAAKSAPGISGAGPDGPATLAMRLSFKEQRDLESIPGRIETLTREREAIEALLSDPAFYAGDPETVRDASSRHGAIAEEIAAAEERWLALEEKRDRAARAKAAQAAIAAGGDVGRTS